MAIRDLAEKRYAEFYRFYVADFMQDISLYLDIAAKYEGPILEIGCATGRLTSRLAQAGHEVHALDVSRPMLEVAQRNMGPWRARVRLSDFDLRMQALQERYHVALIPLFNFNQLIEIEEQRLHLRHLQRSMKSPGIVAVDFFCPISMVRPELAGQWREISREWCGHSIQVRDKREMLTPLLERRIQVFSIDGESPAEFVTHRRYIPPQFAASIFEEAGFEGIRWIQNYDLSTVAPVDPVARPGGPFILLAEV